MKPNTPKAQNLGRLAAQPLVGLTQIIVGSPIPHEEPLRTDVNARQTKVLTYLLTSVRIKSIFRWNLLA